MHPEEVGGLLRFKPQAGCPLGCETTGLSSMEMSLEPLGVMGLKGTGAWYRVHSALRSTASEQQPGPHPERRSQ